MTVCKRPTETGPARFATVLNVVPSAVTGWLSTKLEQIEVEEIAGDLRPKRSEQPIGQLRANEEICFQGVVPAGDGFKLHESNAADMRLRMAAPPDIVRPYIIGRDITGASEGKFIIDLFGREEGFLQSIPEIHQHLVLPFRRENARKVYREKWSIFAEPRPALRKRSQH